MWISNKEKTGNFIVLEINNNVSDAYHSCDNMAIIIKTEFEDLKYSQNKETHTFLGFTFP